MELSFSVKRQPKLKASALNAATRRNLQKAVAVTAFAVEAGAKVRAPVDTGFLRNSIHADVTGDPTATVEVGAEYGVFIHDGVHGQAGTPFLSQSIENERVPFRQRCEKALADAL